MARMRAVVAERPDGPDGLIVRDVTRPEPREGWALVRVEAFGERRGPATEARALYNVLTDAGGAGTGGDVTPGGTAV